MLMKRAAESLTQILVQLGDNALPESSHHHKLSRFSATLIKQHKDQSKIKRLKPAQPH